MVRIAAALLVVLPFAAHAQAPQIARAQATVQRHLADPDGARFRDVRVMPNGSVCGTVNARTAGGGYGGPRPFVVDEAERHFYLPLRTGPYSDEVERDEIAFAAVCERPRGQRAVDAMQARVQEIVRRRQEWLANECQGKTEGIWCGPLERREQERQIELRRRQLERWVTVVFGSSRP